MKQDDIMDLCHKSYNQGYLEGYQDCANQMKNSLIGFLDEISKSLISAVKESVKDLPFGGGE